MCLFLDEGARSPCLEEDLHFVARQRGVDEFTDGAARIYSGEEGGLIALGEEFLTEALDSLKRCSPSRSKDWSLVISIMYLQRKGTKT